MRSSIRPSVLGLLLLLPAALTAPTPAEDERAALEERQDFSAILQLATQAGIPVPTDPVVLLSIAPIAAELASALPTAPVLSVLETAAPSGFLSAIVHDPNYASTWEAAFSAGSSPSWFTALPTSVRAYLHTYNGYAAVATGVAGIGTVEAGGTVTITETSVVGSGLTTETATLTIGGISGAAAAATTSGLQASGASTTAGAAGSTGSGSASAATPSPSSTSTGAAPRQTGVLVAAGMGVLGVLGLAVAL